MSGEILGPVRLLHVREPGGEARGGPAQARILLRGQGAGYRAPGRPHEHDPWPCIDHSVSTRKLL